MSSKHAVAVLLRSVPSSIPSAVDFHLQIRCRRSCSQLCPSWHPRQGTFQTRVVRKVGNVGCCLLMWFLAAPGLQLDRNFFGAFQYSCILFVKDVISQPETRWRSSTLCPPCLPPPRAGRSSPSLGPACS